MARDYKNSKGRGRSGSSLSGLGGFVAGLAIGLAIAAGVYLFDRKAGARLALQAAPMTRDEAPAGAKPPPASASQDAEQRFDFYEMLPKYEVVIPEEGGEAPAAGPGTGPVEKPGSYVLQAGSFRNQADADRVRALIAMQGVESRIQKVTIDRDTWHRVRVGPITSLKQLEETREKLRRAQIDALVIRVAP